MPTHEEHCQDSLRKYGKRFDKLHRWMDEPWELLGKKHRMYRHDPKTTPQEAKKLFGEYADHACLDHIMLDYPELLNSQSGKLGMDTNFCIYWEGDEKAKWCRHCEKAKHIGEPCFELWKIVRRFAASSLVFSNNRRGWAFGHRYRIESPSHERCYLKMLQGKMSTFSLSIEDFLYVTKTGVGTRNLTPSKTRQSPFVDLLLEIIATDPTVSNGAEIVNRVRAIPSKHDPSFSASTSERKKGTHTRIHRFNDVSKRHDYAGTCPKCGSPLVWRRARLTGELYKGCTNYQGGCRYHERSYKRVPKGSKYQNSGYGNEEDFSMYSDAHRGPDDSNF